MPSSQLLDIKDFKIDTLDSDQRHELESRLRALARYTSEIERLEGEKASLKEQEKQIKASLSEQVSHRDQVCRELNKFQQGQRFLNFEEKSEDENSDEAVSTPAINALATLLAKARQDRRDSDLDALLAFGVAEKSVEAIRDGLKVKTVGEFAQIVAKGAWKVKGVGAKRQPEIERAVQDYLSGVGGVAEQDSAVVSASVEVDTRIRKCLQCDAERSQELDRCECGDTVFELADPSPNTTDPSEVADDSVSVELVQCDKVSVRLATVEHEGKWLSSFYFEHKGTPYGDFVPHHNSAKHDDRDASLRHVGRLARRELFNLKLDDASQAMAEYVAKIAERHLEAAALAQRGE